MTWTGMVRAAALLGLVLLGTGGTVVWAQQAGMRRTELQRHDLSVPGREALQVRVEFDPGHGIPQHTHPGEELIYILEGTIEYRIEGRPPAMLTAGQAAMIPAGAVHSARNAGSGVVAALSTYVVEKGKPLMTPVK